MQTHHELQARKLETQAQILLLEAQRLRSQNPSSPHQPVSSDYLKMVRHALISLKLFIDSAPSGRPLLWIGDRKTPVKNLPDYSYATEAIKETERLLNIETVY